MSGPLAVTVAVLSYRRPVELAALLPVLAAECATATDAAVRVLVVDNDPDAGGRGVVTDAVLPASARYVHERREGIAAARNRALDEAAGDDVLVFIDDDEQPRPGWLTSLLSTYLGYGAAAVAGRVVSEFDGRLDPWIEAGGFFRRRNPATGTPVRTAATNNLLLDLAVVRGHGVRFDERFGLSGGEDTVFTRTLTARGERIVWCADAVVTDFVPVARMTRASVLRRALASGNTDVRVDLALESAGRWRVRAHGLARGGLRVVGGGARAVTGTITRTPARSAGGARTAARGLGMAAASLGVVHREYSRPTPPGQHR